MSTRSMVLALSITLASVAATTAVAHADDAQALRDHYELQEGKRVYDEFCRFCHGESGKGKAYNQVSPPPPDVTAPAVQKKSNAELETLFMKGSQDRPWGLEVDVIGERQAECLQYIRWLGR